MLFADFKDLVMAILPLVLLAIWVLSQVLGGQQRPGNPPADPERPVPDRGRRPPADPEAAGGQRNLREEIEQFLKQAAAQREQPSPPPAPREVRREAAPQKRQRAAARQRPPSKAGGRRIEPVENVEIVEDVVVVPESRRGAPLPHLRTHIDTRDVTEHAAHLGEHVGQADERLQQRLHATFDHAVGTLGGSVVPVQDVQNVQDVIGLDRPSSGHVVLHADLDSIRAMLRNPAAARQVILMKEVLDRPESRWS